MVPLCLHVYRNKKMKEILLLIMSSNGHVTVIVDYIVEVASARAWSCDSESDKIPTLPPCLIYQTLLSDFSRVWLRDYGLVSTVQYHSSPTPPPHIYQACQSTSLVPQPLPSEGPGDEASQSISHFC